MAKLDPDNAKSAKDVMDERAAAASKRKRDENAEDDDDGPREKQREGLKLHDRQEKRRKTDQKLSEAGSKGDGKANAISLDERKRRNAEKKAAKTQRKRAKQLKAQQKSERRKAEKEKALSKEAPDGTENELEAEEGDLEMVDSVKIDIDIDGEQAVTTTDRHSTASPSPEVISAIESPQLHSGSSSISSIQPPSDGSATRKSTTTKVVTAPPRSVEPSALTPQQRLKARIEALRAERKADGIDGRPPRNRQELLESRRRKEEERRAHKKELRRKAKEEELRKQEEEMAKRFSPGGSGSLIASPRSPREPGNNFSFGRVAFGDGTQADPSLSLLLEPRKTKGASDVGTALRAAQNKASRLSGLDGAKRAEIEQKDLWLKAKKKAHGERVRDDSSLLKKALKRQEGGKKKSEKEWQGRIEGVAKSQEARQRRRQENLAKRKEDKGGTSKMKGGGEGVGKKAKVKRPGFEGSFKTKPSKGRR